MGRQGGSKVKARYIYRAQWSKKGKEDIVEITIFSTHKERKALESEEFIWVAEADLRKKGGQALTAGRKENKES